MNAPTPIYHQHQGSEIIKTWYNSGALHGLARHVSGIMIEVIWNGEEWEPI